MRYINMRFAYLLTYFAMFKPHEQQICCLLLTLSVIQWRSVGYRRPVNTDFITHLRLG